MYISNLMGLSNVDALEAVYGDRKKQPRASWGDSSAQGDRVTISEAARQLLNMASEATDNEAGKGGQGQTWQEREERSKFAEELRTQLVKRGYSQYMTEDERRTAVEVVLGGTVLQPGQTGSSGLSGSERKQAEHLESAMQGTAAVAGGEMAQNLDGVALTFVGNAGDETGETGGQPAAGGSGASAFGSSASTAADLDAKIAQLRQKIIKVQNSGLPEAVKEAEISALQSQISALTQEKNALAAQAA